MEREKLNSILESKHYLEGGTKEACVKAREFLSNVINPGNQLHAPLSCVKADEFVEAVEILVDYAFKRKDTIPKSKEKEDSNTMYDDAQLIVYKKLAIINGMSFERIAQLTGYTKCYVSYINKGKKPITQAFIEELIDIFELDIVKWHKIVTEVKKLLKNGCDENSIEIWYVIVNSLHEFSLIK